MILRFYKTLFELRIPAHSGSVLEYSFTTENGDLTFGVRFLYDSLQTEEDDEVVLVPERVPCDVNVIDGTLETVSRGVFILEFDNRFSWINTKLLSYKIMLTTPTSIIADRERSMKSRNLLNYVKPNAARCQTIYNQTTKKLQMLNTSIG